MEYIHDEDCPFTEEELKSALVLAYPPEEAARLARDVAVGAAEARARPVPRVGSREFLVLPDFWFGLVATVSPDLSERVERWRRGLREPHRGSRERNAMYSAGLSPRDPPTPEVTRKLDEEDEEVEAQWRRLQAEVATFLGLAEEERWRLCARVEPME